MLEARAELLNTANSDSVLPSTSYASDFAICDHEQQYQPADTSAISSSMIDEPANHPKYVFAPAENGDSSVEQNA